MRKNVTIWYRGANYALGQGHRFYGIWPAGAPQTQPFEWWPETPEGWHGAWSRFAAIEAPGTIIAVRQHAAPGRSAAGAAGGPTGRGAIVAAALLAVGVICGIAGLFPGYLAGASLARTSANLVPHAIYLAAWTASAVLILLGGARLRAGAVLAAGISIVTFGLFVADAGTAIAGSAAGPGLVLGLVGWLACAAGSAMAFRLRSGTAPGGLGSPGGRPGWRGAPQSSGRGGIVTLALAVFAGVGAAVAFAPSWDSFTLRTAAGVTQHVTEGYAFANPGPVIAGDVAVMVAFVAVAIAAALWRPARQGAVLLAGAIISMAAQAISALVQLAQPAAPAQFGISPAQAAQLGLTIRSGLTAAFWVYCAFLVVLAATCIRILITSRPAALSATPAGSPATGSAPAPWPGTAESPSPGSAPPGSPAVGSAPTASPAADGSVAAQP